MPRYSDYPNRSVCCVLDEMRECCKTLNFSYLMGLIEEMQTMANRMEAGLHDKSCVLEWREDKSKLSKELKELEAKIKVHKKELGIKDKDQ